MRIALIGAKGKLGGFLHRSWEGRRGVWVLTRAEVDLRDAGALRRMLREGEFDGLVNCAAMASPEACERDPAGAELVNAVAPEVMAEVCAERGVPMAHFSTDYVVDGTMEGLKDESAPTAATACYARTKREGEERVLERHPGAWVCRVSWVFGEGVPSFLETVVARARGGERLEAVGDKWSKPTSAQDIASALEKLLVREGAGGVVHLVNAGGPESWWTYACKVLRLAREAGVLGEEPPVRRMRLAEVPGLEAPRPVHTGLGSRRQVDLFGAALPPWEAAAAALLRGMAERECH